jgi:outer membrane protein TolC
VARRIEHGDLAPFDQIDADRVVSERAIKVMELDAELAVAAAKLSVYLRDAEGVPIRITDAPPPRTAPAPLPGASREETLAMALVLRPEILLLDAKAEAADAKVRLARTYVLPKLDAKVDVAQPLNVSDPAFKGTEVKFGGTLSAPLPMRGGRGALDAANADRQVVEAERRWVADNVAAELDGAWARLVAADRRLAEAERLVTLAREVEMATRTAFELGDRTLFDLYLREQNRLKTELDRADIAFEREAAAADWLAAQGRVEDRSSSDTATR